MSTVLNPLIPPAAIAVIGSGLTLLTLWAFFRHPGRVPLGRRVTLVLLRLISCAAICAALLQPSWRDDTPKNITQRVAVVLDDSLSMARRESPKSPSRFDTARQHALEVATPGYPLEYSLLADSLRPSSREALPKLTPKGLDSRFAPCLDSLVADPARPAPVLALLFSDGRDLAGAIPEEIGRQLLSRGTRLYAVPCGSDTPLRNIQVSLRSLQPVFLKGQPVMLEARLRFSSAQFLKARLSLLRDGQPMQERVIDIGEEAETLEVFSLPEQPEGQHTYTLKAAPLPEETELSDNEAHCFTQVSHQRLRLLFAEGEPGWDSTFLRRFLLANPRVDIDAFTAVRSGSFASLSSSGTTPRLPLSAQEFRAYDLIILGRDVDAIFPPAALLALDNAVADLGLPMILARGNPSSAPQTFAPCTWGAEGVENAQLRAAPSQSANFLPSNAPGVALCRKLANRKPLSTVLVEAAELHGQSFPALLQRRHGRGLVLSCGAEGLWKWSFQPPAATPKDDHSAAFTFFWEQLILQTALGGELPPGADFALNPASDSVQPGAELVISLVARDSARLASVSRRISLVQPDGSSLKLDLLPVPDAPDRLAASFVPAQPGIYRGELLASEGQLLSCRFAAVISSREAAESRPDHEFLRRLSNASGGSLLKPEELNTLPSLVKQALSQTQPLRQEARLEPLWDTPLYLALLMAVLTLEWFLRRRWGMV
ncbi:MAG: hypothetical protein RL095_3087 [Verrucomicrobiota bacterium]|jgi:hypothetical protein